MTGLAGFAFISPELVAIGALVVAFIVATWLERATPARDDGDDDRRLLVNFGLGLIGFVVASLPWIAPLSASQFAQSQHMGLLPPAWGSGAIGALLAVLCLSLAGYGWHRLMHHFSPLWSLHRLHHGDAQLDFSTGFRTHPVEHVLTALIMSAVVVTLGLGIGATFAALITMQLLDLLSHANVLLPPRVDAVLGWVIATPAAHSRHHSILRGEHDSNFGNGIIIWDRLFGTYSGSVPPLALGLASAPQRNA